MDGQNPTRIGPGINLRDNKQFPVLKTMAALPINVWQEHKRNKYPTNTTEPQGKLTSTAKITRGNTILSNSNSQYSELIELTREIQLINKTCNQASF